MKNQEKIDQFTQEVISLALFFLSIQIPLRIFEVVASDYSLYIVVLFSILSILLGFVSRLIPRFFFALLVSGSLPLLLMYIYNIDSDLSSIFQDIFGFIYILVFMMVIGFKYFRFFIEIEPPRKELEVKTITSKNKMNSKSNWRKLSRRTRIKSILSTKVRSGKYRG